MWLRTIFGIALSLCFAGQVLAAHQLCQTELSGPNGERVSAQVHMSGGRALTADIQWTPPRTAQTSLEFDPLVLYYPIVDIEKGTIGPVRLVGVQASYPKGVDLDFPLAVAIQQDGGSNVAAANFNLVDMTFDPIPVRISTRNGYDYFRLSNSAGPPGNATGRQHIFPQERAREEFYKRLRAGASQLDVMIIDKGRSLVGRAIYDVSGLGARDDLIEKAISEVRTKVADPAKLCLSIEAGAMVSATPWGETSTLRYRL